MEKLYTVENLIQKTQQETGIPVVYFLGKQVFTSGSISAKTLSSLQNHEKVSGWICEKDAQATCYMKASKKEGMPLLKVLFLSLQALVESQSDSMNKDILFKQWVQGSLSEPKAQSLQKKMKGKGNVGTLFLIQLERPQESFQTVLERFANPELVFCYEETTWALLNDCADASQFAQTMLDTINTELMCSVQIGYSQPYSDWSQIPTAFAQAKEAIKIGEVFGMQGHVYGFGQKKMTRLVYHMPPEIVQDFLSDYPGINSLSQEDEKTIEEFFRCNLNTAETSRKLYLHRNTLIYRLEKIHRETGLDMQNMEDALVMKLLLLMKTTNGMKKGSF